jgi:hypothetical protein
MEATSADTSTVAIAAGAGAAAFVVLVAVGVTAVCVCRKRKSAAVVARESQPSQLRSANEYQAVRINPPSVAYDVGRLERPPGDDYSQLQIKPASNNNYGVVDAEKL